jgi:signal transduction histidine kinase
VRPLRPPRSLRARILLVVLAGIAVALTLAVAVTLIILGRTLDREASRVARDRAEVGRELVRATPSGLRVVGRSAAATPSGIWVFEDERLVSAPLTASPEAAAAAATLAGIGAGGVEIDDPALRLEAVPIVIDGQRLGTVVGAVSLVPFRRAERITAIALIVGSVLIVVGLAAIIAVALRRTIGPVDRMARDVAQWSEQGTNRRFALGEPHDEITRLARTLDELLDRIDASLRRERRLTAEISHELRTPVAGIAAESDLALLKERSPEEYREALARTGELARDMEDTIATLLLAAREGPAQKAVSDAAVVIDDAIAEHARAAESAGVRMERADAEGVRIGVERGVAARVLGPVVDNAVRHAARGVWVEAARDDGMIVLRVRDDGPGVATEELEHIFGPAVRGRTAGAHTGAGLGLPLSRRLARAAGGDVRALPGPGGCFEVRLPPG